MSGKIRILGVDPGSQITGVGVVDVNEKRQLEVCYYGCIKTTRKEVLPKRLKQIYDGLIGIMQKFQPDYVALEDMFYSDNVKTAIVMGQARGVALLAPVMMGITPAEYSPREVKLSVVGNGNASKDQVQFMIKNILNLQKEDIPMDASDALAVAICHFHRLTDVTKIK